MEKLKTEFPNDYQERIERLSEYCESSGKTYKNYLATIRSWARKEKVNLRTQAVDTSAQEDERSFLNGQSTKKPISRKKALERANRQSKAPF